MKVQEVILKAMAGSLKWYDIRPGACSGVVSERCVGLIFPSAPVRAYMGFQRLAAILIVQVGFIGQLVSAPQSLTLTPKHGLSSFATGFHGD